MGMSPLQGRKGRSGKNKGTCSFFSFFSKVLLSPCVYSSAARDYIMILAAVPSGAAQEARYPAGTLGDIQAVTVTVTSRGDSDDKQTG